MSLRRKMIVILWFSCLDLIWLLRLEGKMLNTFLNVILLDYFEAALCLLINSNMAIIWLHAYQVFLNNFNEHNIVSIAQVAQFIVCNVFHYFYLIELSTVLLRQYRPRAILKNFYHSDQLQSLKRRRDLNLLTLRHFVRTSLRLSGPLRFVLALWFPFQSFLKFVIVKTTIITWHNELVLLKFANEHWNIISLDDTFDLLHVF